MWRGNDCVSISVIHDLYDSCLLALANESTGVWVKHLFYGMMFISFGLHLLILLWFEL